MALAYSLLVTEGGCLERVLNAVRDIPGVVTLDLTLGPYEIVVKVRAETPADVNRSLARLRSMPEVRSVTTLLCDSVAS